MHIICSAYHNFCELQVKTEVQRYTPSGNWLTVMIKTAIALGNKSLSTEETREVPAYQAPS